jgi:predicted dithiol-disulfide oxidoreductase (DUF899 family)
MPTDEQIQALEQELMEKRRELTEMKKEQTRAEVEDYELKNSSGSIKLSALFGDKEDLVVIHNMGKSCAYCTMWADGLNGLLDHLEDRATVVMVSPDTPDVQSEFADSRNWRFNMISGDGANFIEDMGFRHEDGEQSWWMPGMSTFHKSTDGKITRVGKDFFGPGDVYNGAWHMFDFLNEGAKDWQPKITY